MAENPSGTKLDGWKAIASHLDKSIRTVQRWEAQHGLPVHRIDSEGDHSNSSVFAFRTEVDTWVASRPTSHRTALIGRQTWSRAARWLVGVAATVLLVLLILAGNGQPPADPEPYSARRVDGNRFVVYNLDGVELWTKKFESIFSDDPLYERGTRPWRFQDLNGDGIVEVLFAHRSVNSEPGRDDGLYCYSSDGELLWRHKLGKSLSLDGFDFEDAFKLVKFTFGTDTKGDVFVVVAAAHRPYAPAQVSILDSAGRMIGEYWNLGYVLDMILKDFDGDGEDEILLGGVNNATSARPAVVRPLTSSALTAYERQQGFIALVEHDIRDAISPGPTQTPAYLRMDQEIAYFTFPFTAVSDARGAGSIVSDLRFADQGFYVDTRFDSAEVKERVYQFDDRLDVVQVTFPVAFAALHRMLFADDRLTVSLQEERERVLEINRLVDNRMWLHQ